jgi:hypothetical protein
MDNRTAAYAGTAKAEEWRNFRAAIAPAAQPTPDAPQIIAQTQIPGAGTALVM